MEVEFWMATTASSSFCHATSWEKEITVSCEQIKLDDSGIYLVVVWQSGEFFHGLDDNLFDAAGSRFCCRGRCLCQSIGADQGRKVCPFCFLHGRLLCLHLVLVTVLSLDSNQFGLTHIEPIFRQLSRAESQYLQSSLMFQRKLTCSSSPHTQTNSTRFCHSRYKATYSNNRNFTMPRQNVKIRHYR